MATIIFPWVSQSYWSQAQCLLKRIRFLNVSPKRYLWWWLETSRCYRMMLIACSSLEPTTSMGCCILDGIHIRVTEFWWYWRLTTGLSWNGWNVSSSMLEWLELQPPVLAMASWSEWWHSSTPPMLGSRGSTDGKRIGENPFMVWQISKMDALLTRNCIDDILSKIFTKHEIGLALG